MYCSLKDENEILQNDSSSRLSQYWRDCGEVGTMFIYFGNVPKYKHISRGLKGMLVKF